MPTPSEPASPAPRAAPAPQPEPWAPPAAHPPRSVFGNYRPEPEPAPAPAGALAASRPPDPRPELALARAFLYRYLAAAFEDPWPGSWAWLTAEPTRLDLQRAWAFAVGPEPLPEFFPGPIESYRDAYVAAFGHAARGPCPINEIEYGEPGADALFQPHRLADLAAFYRAFGLEVADDAGERHDHLCLELEFMCVLAAKEAWALEHQLEAEHLDLCRKAQRQFLREHLGRWVPAFVRRLERLAADTPLAALAHLTRRFIQCECARWGVTPGSEDWLLRPVEEAAALCESCGLASGLPGAPAAAAPNG